MLLSGTSGNYVRGARNRCRGYFASSSVSSTGA